MHHQKLKKLVVLICGLLALLTTFKGCDAAETYVLVNGSRIFYEQRSDYGCILILRHSIGKKPSGYIEDLPLDVCHLYRTSSVDDVVFVDSTGETIRKRDVISLDDLVPWTGLPPFRAQFKIGPVVEDNPDPDLAPSYLPYDSGNKIKNYVLIDADGFEISIATHKRTGARFYENLNKCFLATEQKPRILKDWVPCDISGALGDFPETVDVKTKPWINFTNQYTVDKGERMPADNVVIYGSMPIKPLIYSDFPISDSGRVLRGRAMCMADCAPGMLFELLRKGQSIWGSSGKAPITGDPKSAH